jgi:hypothetical protein
MITPNPEVAELTRRARESWQSLRRGESWEHWVTIGRAIDAFRRQLFHDLKINEPKGQAYKEAMGAYLAENGWQQPTKEDPNGIDNTARVNLQKIVERLPEFEAWRATLPLGNLLKQNHPNTVWRAFSKAFAEPGDNGTKRKVETQRLREERDEAIDEVARLQTEVEELRARAETATAEAGFMWDSTPEQVAETMVKANREKASNLAAAIRQAMGDKGEFGDYLEGFFGTAAHIVEYLTEKRNPDELREIHAALFDWLDGTTSDDRTKLLALANDLKRFHVVTWGNKRPETPTVGDIHICRENDEWRAFEFDEILNDRWMSISQSNWPTVDGTIAAVRDYKGLSYIDPINGEAIAALTKTEAQKRQKSRERAFPISTAARAASPEIILAGTSPEARPKRKRKMVADLRRERAEKAAARGEGKGEAAKV